MTARVQPPAYAPVSPGALAAGLAAALRLSTAGRNLTNLLKRRLNAQDVHLKDSGTSALRSAIELAVKQKPGRPIGLPTWACYDVLSAAQGSGARMTFYDLDPGTLQPESRSLAKLGEMEPAGVVVVHAFGIPVDIAGVRRVVGTDPAIIEDAAQGWGGAVHGSPLGAAGDLSVFSFGRGKGITGGRGGALALLSDRFAGVTVAEVVNGHAGWRDLEIVTILAVLGRPQLYGIPASMPWLRLGDTVYKPPRPPGQISRAALALVARSMEPADREAENRRRVATRLRAAVASSPLATNISVSSGATPGWLRLPILARDESTVTDLLRRGRRLGVARSYPKDLPSVAREVGAPDDTIGSVSGAQALATRLVTLPTHSLLTEADIAGLEKLIREG